MNRRAAFMLMIAAHNGQVDKAGEPYCFHPLAVEEAVAGLGEDFAVVALLHDVFEDTHRLVEDFEPEPEEAVRADRHLTPEQANALFALTKYEESYSHYLRRVRQNFIAMVVKVADMNHNLAPERLAGLDPALAKSLAAKYERGRLILLGQE